MIGLPTSTTSSTRSRIDADLVDEIADQAVERGADGCGELAVAARVHHHVRHPAHQVLAESDLRVHRAARSASTSPVGQIAEVPGDRGRADVDGDAEAGVDEPGPDSDDPIAVSSIADRDRAVALVERRLERARATANGTIGAARPCCSAERRTSGAGRRRLVAELGLRHLDVAEA